MEKQDLPDVLEIWLSANLQAHDFIPEAYWKGNLPMVEQLLPKAEVLVCEAQGKILGFSGLDQGYIAGIFVDASARSQGIGKALLEQWKKRYSQLSLCVYEKNEKAYAFYQREGFVVTQKQQDEENNETEYCMQWVRA